MLTMTSIRSAHTWADIAIIGNLDASIVSSFAA
jgi:hypothetical protein